MYRIIRKLCYLIKNNENFVESTDTIFIRTLNDNYAKKKERKKNDYLGQTMDDHVLFLVAQGAQKKIRTAPPPRIKASMAKIVHTVEKGVTRVDSSLLAAGKSTISSMLKPDLLALPSKSLRRLDALSQDISFYFALYFSRDIYLSRSLRVRHCFLNENENSFHPSKNNSSWIFKNSYEKILLKRFLFKG